jgi:hypothetical protein
MLKLTVAPDVTGTDGNPLRAVELTVVVPAVEVLVAVAVSGPVSV